MMWIILAGAAVCWAALFLLAILRAAAMADNAMEIAESGEAAVQERADIVAWLIFHAVAIWSSVCRWIVWRRVCSWHRPKPTRMGGNPLGWKTTNGICRECLAREMAMVEAKNGRK